MYRERSNGISIQFPQGVSRRRVIAQGLVSEVRLPQRRQSATGLVAGKYEGDRSYSVPIAVHRIE